MSNYSKNTNFTAKDSLPRGDPNKKILGSLFDSEFDELTTVIATKEDTANKDAANGYCGLASDTTIAYARLSGADSSFTGTLSGMTGATTGTVYYRIVKGICHIWIESNIAGTSSTTGMTMTGLPAACTPTNSRLIVCTYIYDGTGPSQNFRVGVASVSGTTITFQPFSISGAEILQSSTAFQNSGQKGLAAGWAISYAL